MMRYARSALAVTALLMSCAAPVHAAPLHRYAVSVDEALENFSVTACFDGAIPRLLIADDGASRFLKRIEVRGVPSAKVSVKGNEAAISGAAQDACVVYEVVLQPRIRGIQTGGPDTRRVGADLLTSIGDWLWRPAQLGDGEDIELRFELPPSVAVSAPWRPVPDAERQTYRIAGTPADWPGVVAFGRFQSVAIEVSGARIDLAIVGNANAEQREFARGWIERTVRGVASAYGVFPVPALQAIVVPIRQRGGSPVPWAYVARGGGPAIHLFVDLARGPRDIESDWSVTHEMSHLFLPYVVSRDGWLFEGLPTYLQNVLMARNGAISEEEAWRRMYEGFGRGARVGKDLSLREASERMGRGGLYLRAYWGGAAFLMAADLKLRSRGDPRLSLDTALAGLRECCADTTRRYSAQEVIALMDKATGTEVFSELAATMIDSPDFPDYEHLFSDLDIEMLGGHPILKDGPGAVIRAGIMGKREGLGARD